MEEKGVPEVVPSDEQYNLALDMLRRRIIKLAYDKGISLADEDGKRIKLEKISKELETKMKPSKPNPTASGKKGKNERKWRKVINAYNWRWPCWMRGRLSNCPKRDKS